MTSRRAALSPKKSRIIAAQAVALIGGTHLLALGVLHTGVSTAALLTFVLLYVVRALGITVGFHRLLAHHAFEAHRLFRFVLAGMGVLAMQGGPLWWVAVHRDHHKFTDTERDPHSPVHTGFWRSHMGWMFEPATYAACRIPPRDLRRNRELQWLNRHALLLGLLPIPALFLLGEMAPEAWATSGLQLVVWGQGLGLVLSWHWGWAINSICHLWGEQSYADHDSSQNASWLALLSFGEAWHNNHHRFPSSARFGVRPGQIDLGFAFIKGAEACGWASGVRDARPRVVVEAREPSHADEPCWGRTDSVSLG